jgi:cytochrome c oxidase subunit II
MSELRKNWLIFAAFWVVFTAIGMFLALGLDLLPGKYSDTAHVVDEAYVLLIALAVPVFAMVVALMATCLLRFVVRDTSAAPPTVDGPFVPGNRRLVTGWTIVTSLLALGLAVDPGFVGLRDLRGESRADLVVKVQAQRWSWKFTYPDGGVSTDELVLPVDERVRFDMTSIDIVHSFWIPAFRIKLDTVPGRVTKLYVTPDRQGDYESDFNLRVQCAELCGLGHAAMAVPVRILPVAEFDKWAAGLKKGT